MKKKFILMTTVAVMLIAMLCAFATPVSAEPVITPESDNPVVSKAIAPVADAADLVVMSSEALMIDFSAPAPAPIVAVGLTAQWLAPAVTPIAIMAGGPNKFI